MGVVHCMNVDEKLDSYDGLLEQYATSCELVNRPQSLLSRIEKNLRNLKTEEIKIVPTKSFHHGKTIDETLTKVDKELVEIETVIDPLISSLDSFSKIIRKIDMLLISWKVNRKKYPLSGSISEETKEGIVKNIEQKLDQIEARRNELDTSSIRGSKILTRINKLIKKLKIKSTDFTKKGINYTVDEKFLNFIDQNLITIENNVEAKKPTKYSMLS